MNAILDDADIDTVLDRCQSLIEDMDFTSVLTEFIPEIAAGEAAAFDGQMTPGGEAWAPLKPSTIARKGHNRILFETGALKNSLITPGGPGNVNEVFPRGLVYGTEVPYSIFHTTGTDKMPKREHVGMSSETVDKLCDRVANNVVEQMRGQV